MSRNGYTEDLDPLAHGRWRQAVRRAVEGKRGQALLRDMLEALDAMEDKRLWPGSFQAADGEFCAFGALAHHRGIRVDDLGDEDDCDPTQVGQRFNVAHAMAAEIMYLNDEYLVDGRLWVEVEICGPMRPCWPDWGKHSRTVAVPNENHARERWERMRAWVAKSLKATQAGRTEDRITAADAAKEG